MRKNGTRGENRLLAALASKDRARLYRRFERVEMTPPDILSKSGHAIAGAYFPESGMISLVQTMVDGTTLEVGLIGSEGFFGVPIILEAHSSPVEAMVQGVGAALYIPTNALVNEIAVNPKFHTILLRYAQALMAQVFQTAACNGRHPVKKRLARWLLEAHDRMESDSLNISQEFLSYMLGCRRSGVTVALGLLKADGILVPRRGQVRITDRKGLESIACECYRTVQTEFKRLLPRA